MLSTICILLLDDKKQTKEEEKKRSTWVRLWLARRRERGFYHQLLMEISLAKCSFVASQAWAKSCRVTTRATIPTILSRKFQFWRVFSCDFSSVASPVRGWLHVRFSSRAGDATKFEKIASPVRAKNRSCSRGFIFSSLQSINFS